MMEQHGHVTPMSFKARCGGPALCSVCARERAAEDARLYGDGWLRVDAAGNMRCVEPATIGLVPRKEPKEDQGTVTDSIDVPR